MTRPELDSWLLGYLSYQRDVRRNSHRTVADLKCTLKKVSAFMAKKHGETPLWKLRLEDYLHWIEEARQAGQPETSLSKELSHLRGMLDYAWVRMPIPSGMEAQARALFTGVSTRVFVQFPFGNAGGYVNWDGAWTGFNGDYGHVYSGWSGWKTTGSWALDWNITGYAFMNYGFDAEAVEYRLKQQGAAYMWTPFRFPGQYYDAETDTSANWHRFYDAFTGRFRGPEPMLQEPEFALAMAKEGRAAPAYSYASANPIANLDPTGLRTVVNIWTGWSSHASVYVDNGSNGEPTLFDPGGSYENGDLIHEGSGVLADYAKFWSDRGDPIQQQYVFETTPDQEAQITANFESWIEPADGSNPSVPGPGECAIASSGALNGVGPFKNLGIQLTPWGLGSALWWLKHGPIMPTTRVGPVVVPLVSGGRRGAL